VTFPVGRAVYLLTICHPYIEVHMSQ